MNWVDRLRTSADKRMWSGRRAVVMRRVRRAELLGVKLGCPRSRCRAVVSDMYIYACVYVFVHLCVYKHVYVYAYAYLCIDCESQYQ